MKFEPLYDRVLIEPIDETQEWEGRKVKPAGSGLIVVAQVDKERPKLGKVIAVGTGKLIDGKLCPLNVVEGDTVMFGKYAGSDIEIGGVDYLIMREEELHGVLR